MRQIRFKENFRYLKRKSGMTFKNFALDMNVSRQAMGYWLYKDGLPQLPVLVAIADYFEITLDELVFGDLHD